MIRSPDTLGRIYLQEGSRLCKNALFYIFNYFNLSLGEDE